jgi:hypothetical protein
MQVELSPQAEKLLRDILSYHPGQCASDVIDRALAQLHPTTAAAIQQRRLNPDRFEVFLRDFAQFSSKIPELGNQTFSRETIYGD